MATKEKRSLVDFVKDKKRSGCVVCSLPQDVRDQLKVAREKEIPRRVIREWLQQEYGSAPTEGDFTSHTSGHHEDA